MITLRASDADDNDDRHGSAESADPRALRKALDDNFKEIDSILNKKVMKSLIDMNTETGKRFDILEQDNSAM